MSLKRPLKVKFTFKVKVLFTWPTLEVIRLQAKNKSLIPNPKTRHNDQNMFI